MKTLTMLLVLILTSCVAVQPAHAGTASKLLLGGAVGAAAGYLIGKANNNQPQQTYQPPQPYTNTHSIIMCQTMDGINCYINWKYPEPLTIGQFVRKAGYNYFYRVTPLLQGDKQYIQIEVSK